MHKLLLTLGALAQKLCTTEVGHREPPLARASTGPRNASGGPYQTHASGAVCQCISARGVSFVGLPPGNLTGRHLSIQYTNIREGESARASAYKFFASTDHNADT